MSSNRSEDLARLKEHLEPPWDEVREQRVLTRVLAQREAPAKRYRIVLPAAALVATAACIALIVSWRASSIREAPMATPSSLSPAADQVMALADGSQAVLVREAGLQVQEQRPDRVKIVQR